MFPQPIPPEFQETVERSLSPGEHLISYTEAYTEQWKTETSVVWKKANWSNNLVGKEHSKNVFVGINWTALALTNINLRNFDWRTEKVSTGFLKKESRVVPEIVNSHAIPLSNITSSGSRTFTPTRQPRARLRKTFGRDVGNVMAVNVQYGNSVLDVASPFDEFAELLTNLEATLSGVLVAHRTHDVSSAVETLARLRDEGVLTNDEFEQSKAGFIGRSVDVVESSASTIRQLHALLRSGVLTESEFRMKKWDLLSRPN